MKIEHLKIHWFIIIPTTSCHKLGTRLNSFLRQTPPKAAEKLLLHCPATLLLQCKDLWLSGFFVFSEEISHYGGEIAMTSHRSDHINVAMFSTICSDFSMKIANLIHQPNNDMFFLPLIVCFTPNQTPGFFGYLGLGQCWDWDNPGTSCTWMFSKATKIGSSVISCGGSGGSSSYT